MIAAQERSINDKSIKDYYVNLSGLKRPTIIYGYLCPNGVRVPNSSDIAVADGPTARAIEGALKLSTGKYIKQ